jgi:hypothetical protein
MPNYDTFVAMQGSLIQLALIGFLLFWQAFLEYLDWHGRADVLREKHPTVWAMVNNRPFRLVLLVVAVGLLAKDFRDVGAIGPPPAMKPPPAPLIVQRPQQVDDRTPAQRQFDMLIESNRRLTTGERARLAEALHDFANVLDQAQSVWGKANNIDTELGPTDFAQRQIRLRDLISFAQTYRQDFGQQIQKWYYYDRQIHYVFGDKPDDNAEVVELAAVEYQRTLTSLEQIPSGNSAISGLFTLENERYRSSVSTFGHWKGDCDKRLQQMRSSVQ